MSKWQLGLPMVVMISSLRGTSLESIVEFYSFVLMIVLGPRSLVANSVIASRLLIIKGYL